MQGLKERKPSKIDGDFQMKMYIGEQLQHTTIL